MDRNVASGSGIDDDLKLAQLLQEQECQLYVTHQQLVQQERERAYNLGQASQSTVRNPESNGEQQQASSSHNYTDEELARILQEEEDSCMLDEMYNQAQNLAREHSLDLQPDINVDDMTYEELTELGECVGKVSKGFSQDILSRLSSTTYSSIGSLSSECAENSRCSICQYDFDQKDEVLRLPCGHLYHDKCLKPWLAQQKTCPMCGAEPQLGQM